MAVHDLEYLLAELSRLRALADQMAEALKVIAEFPITAPSENQDAFNMHLTAYAALEAYERMK